LRRWAEVRKDYFSGLVLALESLLLYSCRPLFPQYERMDDDLDNKTFDIT
jgi:hypothetical protein